MPSPFTARLQNWWQQFDHGQQISLSIFAPCAALIVVLAIISFQSSIVMPFRASRGLLQQSDQLLAKQRALTAQQNAVDDRTKDTDGDGLTDYDEVHTYHTSPYLADTDSDGVPDGEEARLGTDPNCPPNRNCYGTAGSPDTVASIAQITITTSTSPGTGTIESPKSPDRITGAEARAYLLRTNLATSNDLSTLPDDAVLELYRRMYPELQATNAIGQIGSNTVPNQTATSTVENPTQVTSTTAPLSPSQPTTP